MLTDGDRYAWRHFIRSGEDAMLQGQYMDAEHYYMQALAHARFALPEDPFWNKTLANLHYLYTYYICGLPTSPDVMLERTVPLWEQVLGSDHHFMKRWVAYIEEWRSELSKKQNKNG